MCRTLSSREHRAVLAKSLIALANFGGGAVVLGFKSDHHAATLPEYPWSQI